ncbi:MAG TPA: immunoglobulin domain-containing protein [Opitutaceae bacterium]
MNLSTATLVALLQRTPVLQLVASGDEFVASSPIGTLLKSAIAAVVGLGAVDSMAGATILADSTDSNPSGTLPALNATVGTAITPLGFQITNTMNVASWAVTGTIPPGLMLTTVEPNGGSLTAPGNLDATTAGSSGDPWSPGTTGNNTTTPILKGTPTTAGTYTFDLQGFAEPAEKGGSGGTFVGTGISAVFPFTVVVAAAASNTPAPVFTTQPVSVTVTGGTVALDAVASNASSYQWMWNGSTPVSGATDSTLLIANAASAAGSYTCVATNSAGTATSNAATLTVTSTANVGRMVNISARSSVGTGASIIFGGFAIGGGTGTLPLLIRASGPAIAVAPFNVGGTLADPMLQLFNSAGTAIAGDLNTGWAGNAQVSADAAAVGAFGWSTPTSHDAALDLPLAVGSYTAQVSGESGDTGVAIMEVYDATPAASYASTPLHLTNLSARVLVGSGANALFAGFVIKGDTAMTVLIRASGPAISVAPFNVGGTIPDPVLTLQNQSTSATIASNAAWGGDTEISSTAMSVGAFGWSNPASKDSALLITLPPGNYTANVAGASADSGVAIVEVYEVQ